MKIKPMTEGPILRPILAFTIPILLSSVFQTLYNAVDSIIVGRFAENGTHALAAVGSTGAIYNLFVGFFIGISSGAGVVVAQYFGARDDNGVSKSVHTAIALSLIIGTLITIAGIILSPWVVNITGTPEEIKSLAVEYLRILFYGMIPSILYNFCAGILRSVGDSKRPLIYLIISSIINVVFNCIFVICFNMDVDGVGWSTVIATAVSTILVIIRLKTTDESYKLSFKKLRIEKLYLTQILKIGVPSGLQSVMFNFSNVLVQSQINSFGAIVVAARSAVSKFEGIIYACANSFALSVTTFSGQNKGARQYDRIIRGANICMITSTLILAGLCGISIIFRNSIISMFDSSPEVIQAGGSIFTAMMSMYFMLGIMEVLTGTIRGAGAPFIPMISTTLGIFGGRIAWIYIAKYFFPDSIIMVILGYPVSWTIIVVALLLYYIKYRNRWLYS